MLNFLLMSNLHELFVFCSLSVYSTQRYASTFIRTCCKKVNIGEGCNKSRETIEIVILQVDHAGIIVHKHAEKLCGVFNLNSTGI